MCELALLVLGIVMIVLGMHGQRQVDRLRVEIARLRSQVAGACQQCGATTDLIAHTLYRSVGDRQPSFLGYWCQRCLDAQAKKDHDA